MYPMKCRLLGAVTSLTHGLSIVTQYFPAMTLHSVLQHRMNRQHSPSTQSQAQPLTMLQQNEMLGRPKHFSTTVSNGCSSVGMTSDESDRSQLQRWKEGNEFINNTVPRLLSKAIKTFGEREGPVVKFVQPDVLKTKIDFCLKDEALTNAELESLLDNAIDYFVKTGHPYFYNQLFTGMDYFALSGAYLTEALNCSAYTYEIGPVSTLIEDEIIRKVGLELVGYQQVDGIFTPGGSIANMYGLSMAKHHLFPDSKSQGIYALPPVHIYTSRLSHYSIKKAAFFLGFGLDNVVLIDTDEDGRMIVECLEKAIQASLDQGVTPLFVNATAGTTVFGAYDAIDEIADVCQKFGNIWLHVDGCWGGAVLLSDKLRYKMKGINRADSLAWDPHKMSGSILQCSVFLTQHEGLLAEAHSTNARYLFQQDKVYDSSYDTGDKSIQCGRKIDAFKLWVQWKAYGNAGMAERVEVCFDNALYLRDLLGSSEGFRLVLSEPQCTNVCFWYIPRRLRNQPQNDEWWQQLSTVAPAVKARMQMTGTMMIGYQPQGHLVNFFRMICSNPTSTKDDMEHILRVISQFGEE